MADLAWRFPCIYGNCIFPINKSIVGCRSPPFNAEEKVLREHGVDENTIEQIRMDDRADFNSNRRFYHLTKRLLTPKLGSLYRPFGRTNADRTAQKKSAFLLVCFIAPIAEKSCIIA